MLYQAELHSEGARVYALSASMRRLGQGKVGKKAPPRRPKVALESAVQGEVRELREGVPIGRGGKHLKGCLGLRDFPLRGALRIP